LRSSRWSMLILQRVYWARLHPAMAGRRDPVRSAAGSWDRGLVRRGAGSGVGLRLGHDEAVMARARQSQLWRLAAVRRVRGDVGGDGTRRVGSARLQAVVDECRASVQLCGRGRDDVRDDDRRHDILPAGDGTVRGHNGPLSNATLAWRARRNIERAPPRCSRTPSIVHAAASSWGSAVCGAEPRGPARPRARPGPDRGRTLLGGSVSYRRPNRRSILDPSCARGRGTRRD